MYLSGVYRGVPTRVYLSGVYNMVYLPGCTSRVCIYRVYLPGYALRCITGYLPGYASQVCYRLYHPGMLPCVTCVQ